MVIQWIAIAILVLLGLFFLKVEHHGQKIKMITLVILALVVYFSIVGHFSSEEVNFSSPRGIINGVYLYFGWIGQTASSLYDIGVDTTHMVGNAIKINKTEERPRR